MYKQNNRNCSSTLIGSGWKLEFQEKITKKNLKITKKTLSLKLQIKHDLCKGICQPLQILLVNRYWLLQIKQFLRKNWKDGIKQYFFIQIRGKKELRSLFLVFFTKKKKQKNQRVNFMDQERGQRDHNQVDNHHLNLTNSQLKWSYGKKRIHSKHLKDIKKVVKMKLYYLVRIFFQNV